MADVIGCKINENYPYNGLVIYSFSFLNATSIKDRLAKISIIFNIM